MGCPSMRVERVSVWFLVGTGSLFAALWLTVLVPFAFGGPEPTPQGPGGAPYPVFVLDLVVALPCVVAVGVLLLQGRVVGTPLAVVVLVKVVTLFTVLWAGVAVQAMTDVPFHLGADAGPSALLLAVSGWLTVRWLGQIRAVEGPFMRDTLWGSPLDLDGRRPGRARDQHEMRS